MDDILISLVAILAVGVLAQWIAWRINAPSILILLAVGLLAGPGLGWLDPDALFGELLLPLVSLSVAVILYEGGLSLRFSELRQVGPVVRNLCTIGATITWLAGTLLAYWVFDVSWNLAFLLGALFIVTGPTVIGPLLRLVRPQRGAATVLKWEGIVTDPLGVMVAVLVFEWFAHGSSGVHPLRGVAMTLGAGGLIGAGAGLMFAFLLRRHLLPDHLQNPVSLMLVMVVLGVCDRIQPESGLLGVTVMGVVLANRGGSKIRHIAEFKENLQVLLLSVLFVLLSARIDRAVLLDVSWRHVVFLLGLVVVVRPAAVFVSTWRSAMPWPQRIFLGLVAPRGIVSAAMASVLALEMHEQGIEEYSLVVPVAFFVIVGTVVIYGLGAPIAARMLGVASKANRGLLILGAHDFAREMVQALQRVGGDVLLVDTNRRNVMRARMEGLEVTQENILAEGALEDIDLSGRGTFLALTSNDEVNALACGRMSELLGRSKVFQLVAEEESYGETELEMGGRRLFNERVNFGILARRHRNGWRFKATQLSENFTLDDYYARYSELALPLFVVSDDGSILTIESELPHKPRQGERLVGLVPPESEEQEPEPTPEPAPAA